MVAGNLENYGFIYSGDTYTAWRFGSFGMCSWY